MYIYDMHVYIYIYVSMCKWYFYRYLSIFYISHNKYFDENAMYIKSLKSFSVPDVGSSVIPVSSVVSVVFSLTVMVSEDTVGNKVEICIHKC